MHAMCRTIRTIGRIAYLFLYAVYALTPVQMYAMSGRSLPPAGQHISADIVWVNVLFSLPDDENDAPSPSPLISAGSQQGGDVVLVRKRCALFREQFDVNPLFDAKLLSAGCPECRPTWSPHYALTKDPLLRETDGCFTLTSGLSPPSFLS